ncbi:MAG: hypothetical protein IJP80_09035 [Bacteroidales bacterium]|nr:hypothetical protein [Bacteroidales bacterium]
MTKKRMVRQVILFFRFYSNTQAFKHSSIQAFEHSSIQAFKHSSIQTLKHSSIPSHTIIR